MGLMSGTMILLRNGLIGRVRDQFLLNGGSFTVFVAIDVWCVSSHVSYPFREKSKNKAVPKRDPTLLGLWLWILHSWITRVNSYKSTDMDLGWFGKVEYIPGNTPYKGLQAYILHRMEFPIKLYRSVAFLGWRPVKTPFSGWCWSHAQKTPKLESNLKTKRHLSRVDMHC